MMFNCTVLNVNPLKCISMNNRQCKIIPQLKNVNSNEPSFYPYSILVNKCSYNCNNINGPYAKFCVPDVVRKFNLTPRTNETRPRKWHETCKYKFRLDVSLCNNKRQWNSDKCRFEWKELIYKRTGDKGFI